MKVLHVVVAYESSEQQVVGDLKWLLEQSSICGATEEIFKQIIDQLEEK